MPAVREGIRVHLWDRERGAGIDSDMMLLSCKQGASSYYDLDAAQSWLRRDHQPVRHREHVLRPHLLRAG